MADRQLRGRLAHRRGIDTEAAATAALIGDGWVIRGQRVRTPAGEIDLVAEKDGLLAIVEVKARPTLAGAAEALGLRQRARLIAAAEALLADHPDWGPAGVRFDVIVADAPGTVRRIAEAFRVDG
jgi:putative endonuclease